MSLTSGSPPTGTCTRSALATTRCSSKTESVALAIKAQDPSAQTLGPVGWGWSSLFFSGKDQQTCAVRSCGSVPPDEKAHGGVPFATWYLRAAGRLPEEDRPRLLDYFDNHWYPQENGVTSNADGPAEQALRLRSTRMLWDPNYRDQSWINQPVMAIPRMKQLVARNYPGTKVAISEYNFGALNRIDGGLAEADVLGIFGKEGLDLATLWGPPAAQQPGAFAFGIYLDYDGHGSKFGDTSVHALSGNQGEVSVYAAQRTSDHALTIIVINKSTKTVASPLSIAGLAARARAQVYRYGQAKPGKIVHAAPQAFDGGHARVTLPGYSITEYVISAGGLTRAAILLPRATATTVLRSAGRAGGPSGPADAFSWATGYKGRKVDPGWRPGAG